MPVDDASARRYFASVERRSESARRLTLERTEERAHDYLLAMREEAGARAAILAEEARPDERADEGEAEA